MNAMTCEEVQEQLDLLAAGACDPPTKDALEQHLAACPACSARYAESQRLLGLLDLHWNDQGVERLRQRIEQQARPTQTSSGPQTNAGSPTPFGNRRRVTPFIRRAVAVAAVLLIAIGLVLWAPNWGTHRNGSEPAFALLVQAPKEIPAPEADKTQALVKNAEAVAVIPLGVRGGAAFRRELRQAERDGKLPAPPAISLDLVLMNTGKRPVEVRLGDAPPTLELDVTGDAVVRIPAAKAEPDEAKFLRHEALRLSPGEQHVLHIDRLIAGSRGKLEYIYLTEPGEYTLTARLRLTADGKIVTVTGAPPVRIKVKKS